MMCKGFFYVYQAASPKLVLTTNRPQVSVWGGHLLLARSSGLQHLLLKAGKPHRQEGTSSSPCPLCTGPREVDSWKEEEGCAAVPFYQDLFVCLSLKFGSVALKKKRNLSFSPDATNRCWGPETLQSQ